MWVICASLVILIFVIWSLQVFSQWPFHHLHLLLLQLLQGSSPALHPSILLPLMARAEALSWAPFRPSAKADWKKRWPTIAAIHASEQHFLRSLVVIVCNLSLALLSEASRIWSSGVQRCFKTGLLGETIFNISLPNRLQICDGHAKVCRICAAMQDMTLESAFQLSDLWIGLAYLW